MLKASGKSVVQKLGTNMAEDEDEVSCWCLLLAIFFVSQGALSFHLECLHQRLGCEKRLTGVGQEGMIHDAFR